MGNILMNNEVPAEAFLKYLIRDNKILKKENSILKEQFGKDNSYIEELEERIKEKENEIMLLRQTLNEFKIDGKRYYKEMKKEEMYQEIENKFNTKKEKYKTKISELEKKLEISRYSAGKFWDKIKEYETKFGTI